MAKQEVMEDAQKYANQIGANAYVLRRGDVYKASRNLPGHGWKLAEIVTPKDNETPEVDKILSQAGVVSNDPLVFYYGLRLWTEYLEAKAQWEFAQVEYISCPMPIPEPTRQAEIQTRNRMNALLVQLRATPEHKEAFGW